MDLTVHRNERATVEEKATSITSLEVRIQIDTSVPSRSVLNEVKASVELSELVMATTSITDDLDAI